MPCNMLILIRLFQNNIDISNFYGDLDKDID